MGSQLLQKSFVWYLIKGLCEVEKDDVEGLSVGFLKVTDEKSRIRVRSQIRIRNPV